MSETQALIRCPVCPSEDICEHDQDERRALCDVQHVEPEPLSEQYIASDPAQVDAKRKRATRKAKQAENDIIAVMKTIEGRRFIARLLQACGLNRRSFNPANPDPQLTAWLDGHRDVGLGLTGDLTRICPELFVQMEKETRDGEA